MCFLACVHTKLLQSCPTLCDPMDCPTLTPYGACQVPLSMGFSRQQFWGRLPCPPPGDLPDRDPVMELVPLKSPALAGGFFTTSAT